MAAYAAGGSPRAKTFFEKKVPDSKKLLFIGQFTSCCTVTLHLARGVGLEIRRTVFPNFSYLFFCVFRVLLFSFVICCLVICNFQPGTS